MRSVKFNARFWVAATLILIILVIALIGPIVVSTDPNTVIGGLYDRPDGSRLAMALGTDNEGQSVLSNLVVGTRTSLLVGLIAGLIATMIGLVIGLVAGYRGGIVDDILAGFTNIALSIPAIVVLILLSVAVGSASSISTAVVIGVTSWPWLARAVRAQASSIRVREHIDVARLSGARSISILAWDVLPYLLSYVVMAFVLQMVGGILAEATLSLLGLGASGSTSLGIMLYWALVWGSVRVGALWAFLPPTLMLTLIAFAFFLLQSSLTEIFNPRLRQGKAPKKKRPAPKGPAPVASSSGTAVETSEPGSQPGSGVGTEKESELVRRVSPSVSRATPKGATP
ncbi:MAG: ABC transporter permease [Propionibacteriaceae bacterium]